MGALISQARVDAIVARLEGDGPRHRLRRYPMDLVAEAVRAELAHWPVDEPISDDAIAHALATVTARN